MIRLMAHHICGKLTPPLHKTKPNPHFLFLNDQNEECIIKLNIYIYQSVDRGS